MVCPDFITEKHPPTGRKSKRLFITSGEG